MPEYIKIKTPSFEGLSKNELKKIYNDLLSTETTPYRAARSKYGVEGTYLLIEAFKAIALGPKELYEKVVELRERQKGTISSCKAASLLIAKNALTGYISSIKAFEIYSKYRDFLKGGSQEKVSDGSPKTLMYTGEKPETKITSVDLFKGKALPHIEDRPSWDSLTERTKKMMRKAGMQW